jgi:hypothetical protein
MARIASCRLVRGYRTDSICDSVPASLINTGFSLASRLGFGTSLGLFISGSVVYFGGSCSLRLTVCCRRLTGAGFEACSAYSSYAL